MREEDNKIKLSLFFVCLCLTMLAGGYSWVKFCIFIKILGAERRRRFLRFAGQIHRCGGISKQVEIPCVWASLDDFFWHEKMRADFLNYRDKTCSITHAAAFLVLHVRGRRLRGNVVKRKGFIREFSLGFLPGWMDSDWSYSQNAKWRLFVGDTAHAGPILAVSRVRRIWVRDNNGCRFPVVRFM